MIDSIEPPASVHLHVTTETLPISIPKTIKELSEADIAGYLFSRLQELDVAYDDVVKCMLDHIELGGSFKRKRVGLAYQSEIPVC